MSVYRVKVGDHRKRHPVPLRLRNPFIPRELGGSEGWRGPGWNVMRRKVLAEARGRSSISPNAADSVDHIIPQRLGGKNTRLNLRAVDQENNPHADLARGFRERRPGRFRRY